MDAPALRRFTMYFDTGDKLVVSVSALALEKLAWGCTYIRGAAGLGCWGLDVVNVDTCSSDFTSVTKLFFEY
jgi:hypothetical protein